MFDIDLPLPRKIHHYSDMIAVCLGYLFNISLLVVVLKNKDKGLKSFRQIVFMNCVLDLFLTTTTLIAEMECESYKGILYFFASSFLAKMVSPFWHYILIYIFCLGIGFSMFYAPIPFYHRYMLICKDVILSRKQIVTILLIPMSLSIWICGWQFYSMLQTDKRRAEFSSYINNTLWRQEDGTLPMFAAYPMDNIPAIVYLGHCLVCFPIAWGLPFYFFKQIYKSYLNSKDSMSPKAQKLYIALNRALISQAVIPFVFGSMAPSLTMTTLLFRFDIPFLANIAAASISWVPAINPFLTFLFIPSYRRALIPKAFLRRVLTNLVDTSTVDPSVVSMTNNRTHSKN
ncbi:hypothetical protein M3Y97_00646600 [Aphelenchoides bicaudatus]|nr:hypothetical protein M3Y97_00646600 [Aphelenchoides bicaudatus]